MHIRQHMSMIGYYQAIISGWCENCHILRSWCFKPEGHSLLLCQTHAWREMQCTSVSENITILLVLLQSCVDHRNWVSSGKWQNKKTTTTIEYLLKPCCDTTSSAGLQFLFCPKRGPWTELLDYHRYRMLSGQNPSVSTVFSHRF